LSQWKKFALLEAVRIHHHEILIGLIHQVNWFLFS